MSAPTRNTNYVTDGRIAIDIFNLSSAAAYTPGESHIGSNGTEWVYVQSAGALSKGDLVAINGGSILTGVSGTGLIAATNTLSVRYGFVQTAFLSSQWGFVAVRGAKVLVRVAGAVSTPGRPLYTTDTAGALGQSSASASQFQVFGVNLESSVSASGSTATVATANISFPIARFPKIGGG
jgi:hypothetical protein